jgi:hypothetical protein
MVAGLGLSFVIQGVLTWSVAVDGRRGPRAAIAVVALLLTTLAMMVWRPTWHLVRP